MAIPSPISDAPTVGLSGRSTGQDVDPGWDDLLTVDDVAALLKVSKNWVYAHTRSRRRPRSEQLPHMKVGKYLRFDPHALRRFIADKCRTT